MLDALNFVRGAVAKKDLIPVLTHFRIMDGKIQGSNGCIAMQALCDDLKGLDFTVPADLFLRAVDTCKGKPTLVIKDTLLYVKKDRLKITLPLYDNSAYPMQRQDTGVKRTIDVSFLNAVRPFIGSDASRIWSCGVLLTKKYAYATNNIVLVRTPINNGPSEPLLIPVYAVDELIRIGLDYAITYTAAKNSVTFYYTDGAWIKAQLYNAQWPEVDKMFGNTNKRLDEKILCGIQAIAPFCPDPKAPIITFSEKGITTSEKGTTSATLNIGKLPKAVFRMEPLLDVLTIATHFDWSVWPEPCPFKGNGIEGVIVGMVE